MTIPAVDGRCTECGFDYETPEPAELIAYFEELPGSFEELVTPLPDEVLRSRPEPTVWSVLEYTCHVRDVLEIQRERLARAVAEERPVFPRTGMWQWPERDGYNTQDPADVLRVLRRNAALLAAAVRGVGQSEWERRLVYSYPEAAERTVLWLVRHTAHEGRHHLFDIRRIVDEPK